MAMTIHEQIISLHRQIDELTEHILRSSSPGKSELVDDSLTGLLNTSN